MEGGKDMGLVRRRMDWIGLGWICKRKVLVCCLVWGEGGGEVCKVGKVV